MQRRTFLKESAVGIGALAAVCGGVLKLRGETRDQDSAGHGRGDAEESQFSWGTNAVVLNSPWNAPPSVDEMLADSEHTLVLNRFYRVAGDPRPATPTECRIAYNSDALFVAIRCQESDMSFPYANLDADEWPSANWHSLQGLPAASNNWPPYPDEVDLLIQPDPETPCYYQFAATLQGMQFGCSRLLSSDSDVAPDQAAAARHPSIRVTQVEGFETKVTKGTDGWVAFFQIPWHLLGKKPQSHFGFLPLRTRWRDGEFSSLAALDVNEGLPVDLLIETHFSGPAEVKDGRRSVCELPSGILRWQRPAALTYPGVEICRQIWQLQSSLTTPTDKGNLAQRLYLAQRWMDLMMLEGFTPLPRSWGDSVKDLTQALFRQRVNAAFEKQDLAQACQRIDTYLAELDTMSRWWYADGSPGDILTSEWKPVTSADSLEVEDNTLLMHCVAGGGKVDLRLGLPATGGIRLYGSNEGYWRPADLLPLKVTRGARSCSIHTLDGKIVVHQAPFSISFYDAADNEVTRVGANSLAFRFDGEGGIRAIDFRNQLHPDEVIYGFGEKYDRFNHNGSVLTLWGTDDWVGNGEGLANTTYKPLPIFHSSKSYMVFDNSSYRLRADIGKTDPNEYRLTQQGPILDLYFWIGPPAKALQSYTALTGRVPVPPKWAFEPWMGRGGDAWASGRLHNAVAEEESVALRFAELDIPHSAIYAEGPSALSPELNQFMAARGIRVLGYFYPVIPLARQRRLMPELKQSELPYLRFANGDVAPSSQDTYVDFTNPHAMELCRRALREALDLGEAGSMVDFGDMTPDGAIFYDGQRGADMHNFFYYDYQRTVSEVFREKRGNDFILYARGAAPGTQRWVGQFAGDHPANFNGLKHVLTGALNLCACGYSNWGSDLGGYFGFPQPAVYMRWFQFGCFSPLMRPHGTAPRDPWYFGEAAVTNYKFLAWTRENILNYTYNAAVIAHDTGTPMMRSMPVAFPGEPRVAAVSDQYMFGPSLMVAPVLNEDTSRSVAFPSGVWASLWDGKTYSGPATLTVSAPPDTIPVYLKPGAVVPVQLGRELQFGKSMASGRADAMVVTCPVNNENVCMLNNRGEAASVAVESKHGGGGWTLKNLPEMTHLLVYGATAVSAVRVDGAAVAKGTTCEPGATQVGWEADPSGNRIVIRLPARQVEQSAPITKVEIDFAAN